MWKKSEDFSQESLARLLRSPQAQALAQLLGQMDSSTLNQAAAMASQGQTEDAKQLLQPLLQNAQVQALLKQMEDSHG